MRACKICLVSTGSPRFSSRRHGSSVEPARDRGLLDERFRLLTGGRRTAVERHKTLRATVDWSYSMLEDCERLVFDRLGGVRRHVRRRRRDPAVASDDDLAEWDVRDALTRLVRRSMVNADRDDSGNTRYSLLETLKEYASEQLHQRSEVEDRRRRHAQHFACRWPRPSGRSCAHATSSSARGQILSDVDNLRTAVEWAASSSDPDDQGLGITIAAAALDGGVGEHQERHRSLVDPDGAVRAHRAAGLPPRRPGHRGLRRRPPRRRLGQCPGVFALDACRRRGAARLTHGSARAHRGRRR